MTSYCKHCELKKRIQELEELHRDAVEENLISDREIKNLSRRNKSLELRNERLKHIIVELNARINRQNESSTIIEEVYYDSDE